MMVNCLRSGIKHSSSRRLVQAVIFFGWFLRFPHKDFIDSFRIVFPMKCRPTEDVGMYFLLETKMKGKQPPGNTLQSYLFLVTNYPSAKQLSTLVSHFSGGLWMMAVTVFD